MATSGCAGTRGTGELARPDTSADSRATGPVRNFAPVCAGVALSAAVRLSAGSLVVARAADLPGSSAAGMLRTGIARGANGRRSGIGAGRLSGSARLAANAASRAGKPGVRGSGSAGFI